MNKKTSVYILYFVSILVIGFYILYFINSNQKIVNTHTMPYVDLSQVEFSNTTAIGLNGTWIKTTDNYNDLCEFPKDLLEESPNNTTYKISIKLPDIKRYYTISIPRIYKRYSVRINNEVVFENVYEDGTLMLPLEKLIKFYADTQDINIAITTYEDMPYYETLKSSVYIGLPIALQDRAFKHNIPFIIFMASVLLSAIYFLGAFINNPKHNEFLSFSLLNFASFFYVFVNDSSIFYIFMRHASARDYLFLNNIILIVILIMGLNHFNCLFPKHMLSKLSIPLFFACIAYLILVFIIPIEYNHILLPLCTILLFIGLIVLLMTCINAIFDKEENAYTYLFCLVLINAGIFIDIYFFRNYSTSSSFYLLSSFIYNIIQVEIFLRTHVNTLENELKMNKLYSSSIAQKKNEETNFLSVQLKAHFLFNALNIISGYSLFDTEKAKNITKSLLVYLKQLFEHDNLNELNSLQNEMELVKAFAYIELERFPGLTISYDIPDELPELMMPSLTLQPLLENAVNHGVRKKNYKGIGNIVISIHTDKNYVYFSIKDDGAGNSDMILKSAFESNTDGKFHSLQHIQMRLKKLYNETLIIRSINNVGTFISFKIPIN